jgi:hypothetical protein
MKMNMGDKGLGRRQLNRKTLTVLCATTALLMASTWLAPAIPISVISGATGSFMADQSYNETRAVDVTVLSPENLLVQSMTLNGIGGSGAAEAVIYDLVTHDLVASANGTVSGGTVTVAISATLLSGDSYAIGFYGHLSNGTLFLPNHFPYVDSSGLLQINGASESPTDTFPLNSNLGDPQITMNVSPVPESGNISTLAIGMFGVWGFRRWSQSRARACGQNSQA